MRIALIGYGKMGKQIDLLAASSGHEVVYRIGSANRNAIHSLKQVDVAIEFTQPDSAVENLLMLAGQKIPTVCGTTGWNAHRDQVESAFLKAETPFFWASNFSIGVHIAHETAAFLARMMARFQEYRPSIEEWHHTAKKDAPSGTALTLGEALLQAMPQYQTLYLQEGLAPEQSIAVQAHREGEIVGTHQIKFRSANDELMLEHKALNRSGFAMGALKAAQFIHQKERGIYTMHHLIHFES